NAPKTREASSARAPSSLPRSRGGLGWGDSIRPCSPPPPPNPLPREREGASLALDHLRDNLRAGGGELARSAAGLSGRGDRRRDGRDRVGPRASTRARPPARG